MRNRGLLRFPRVCDRPPRPSPANSARSVHLGSWRASQFVVVVIGATRPRWVNPSTMERSRRSKRPSDSSEHETTNSLHDRKNKKRRSKQQQQPADDNNDNQDHPQPKLVGQPQPDLDKENSQNGVAFVADDYDEEEAIIIANTNAAELEPKVVSGEDEDADPDDFVADADAAADDEDEEFVGDAEVNENENDEEAEADAQEATNNTNSNNNMDDAEEEVADASLPRQLQKKKRAFGESAEVGVITKIYCQDFMCHRKLTVDLNRNINFIHGQNGSGTKIAANTIFHLHFSLF